MNKKPNEAKKTKLFSMWVTEGELLQLRKQAHKNNTTMSQHMRNILFLNTIQNI